ncbi:hypothetical protein BGX20_003173, partial [Mortierella sp. AD010]
MSNSVMCGVQGIATSYMSLLVLCLCVLLIGNLHLLTVFRSSAIQNHMTELIVLAFILPLASTIPVGIRKKIENPGFGSICFVSPDVADAYFFYPIAVLACIGGLAHLGTIAFIVKVCG